MPVLFESSLKSLPLLSRGKVRDIYAVGDDKLLIVTTDRLSAFDVILDDPIPGKGCVLNDMTNFWLEKLMHLIPNHLTGIAPESVVSANEIDQVQGRSVVVKRLKPVPIEAVVRGYLIGSGWKDYQATETVCGIKLPSGLRLADRLPQAIFTPASKAAVGAHDENISFEKMQSMIGLESASDIRAISLSIYNEAASYALEQGIIIADTKFEFGYDNSGVLHIMDEVLTPDSSRFWPAVHYSAGSSPPSFDKQFVRDWLETQSWDKNPPAPRLPRDIIDKTAAKYREALVRLQVT